MLLNTTKAHHLITMFLFMTEWDRVLQILEHKKHRASKTSAAFQRVWVQIAIYFRCFGIQISKQHNFQTSNVIARFSLVLFCDEQSALSFSLPVSGLFLRENNLVVTIVWWRQSWHWHAFAAGLSFLHAYPFRLIAAIDHINGVNTLE